MMNIRRKIHFIDEKGIARQLVLVSGIYALKNFGLENLIIVADAGSIAENFISLWGLNLLRIKLALASGMKAPTKHVLNCDTVRPTQIRFRVYLLLETFLHPC